MHIPRQTDGSGGAGAVRADDLAELRARRRRLVGQLRAVGYWQRLVQARTDLSVAGLLYAAPVPTALPATGWSAGTDGDDTDLSGLSAPPDGLDVARLLAGSSADGPGLHLDRLREVSGLLVRHSRALQEELDLITTALHGRLLLDGTEDPLDEPAQLRADQRADERAALG